MLISIITPTYNRAELLLRTIGSILNQTFQNWELIIVDDGSTDDTENKIKHLLNDERIKLFKKENTGASHSRNVGVTQAVGDFITFLDSDDEAFPNWLEEIYKNIDEETAIICCGAVRNFNDKKQIEELPWDFRLFDERLRVKFTCGSLIIKKTIFEKIGGYDIELKSNQHSDLGIRLLLHLKNKQYKKKAILKSLIIINVHEGERIRTNWKQVSEGSKKFVEKHYQFLSDNKNSKQIASIYSVIAFSNYKQRNKKTAIIYILKSIKYNPLNIKNYFRTIKYSLF